MVFVALGVVFLLCGVAAIGLPIVSTLAVSLVVGIALVIAGAAAIIHAFRAGGWRGFVWNLLIGVIALVGGLVVWFDLFAGAFAVTLLIGCVFVAKGVAQLVLAFRLRPDEGWGWLLVSGGVSLLAGLWLLLRFPIAGFFAPGVIAGVAFLFEGWAFLAIGLAARRARSGRADQPKAA